MRERAHSERHKATDGGKRRSVADSSTSTPKREDSGVKPCVRLITRRTFRSNVVLKNETKY